ncbi:MAG: IPT/TIG domain-containing protein [Prevotella sp.]|jgi:hypothetical protein|nr:IPT/TIG domain-containing protein [Prevotella sp.]
MNKKQLFLVCLFGLLLYGCSDSNDVTGYNPNNPVTFTDFTPTEGGVRTRLFINGSNLETDVSKIAITIGGKSAKVIGSSGKTIYCMVPMRAYGDTVIVNFLNDQGDTVVKHVFPKLFNYKAQTSVGTLIRQVDEKGNSKGDIYGPFDSASVNSVDYMVFQEKEGEKSVYLSGWGTGIHKLDLVNKTYSLVLPKKYNEMRSFTFTDDGDTLLIPDDNGQATGADRPNIYYALHSENFQRLRPYHNGPCSFTICSHPGDHTVFYQTYSHGGVYKVNGTYNPSTGKYSDKLLFNLTNFLIASDGVKENFIVHPSGKYMYIVGPDMHAILRSNYNEKTKEFEYPTIVCGSASASGYAEGVGTAARLSYLMVEGVFVKNQEYVKEGKEDQYDFYLADSYNDCIRKITPEGATSLIAGRANINKDGYTYGYVDGDPIKEARLWQPRGIAYDPETGTFYFAESNNHDVRYITTE